VGSAGRLLYAEGLAAKGTSAGPWYQSGGSVGVRARAGRADADHSCTVRQGPRSWQTRAPRNPDDIDDRLNEGRLIARSFSSCASLHTFAKPGRRAGAAPSLWQGRPQRWMSIRLRQENANAVALALDSQTLWEARVACRNSAVPAL
jgi:hypothetical protein